VYEQHEKFQNMLEAWFIQELPTKDAQGIAGKKGRVEIKTKELPTVEDWSKFCAYIQQTGAFELLNRAVNPKAVRERWENKEEVPGVGKFVRKVVSLTKVKE